MMEAGNSVSIGNCRLLLQQRVLLAEGKPVQIGSRALDLLIRLAEIPGQTVSVSELMQAAWPNSVVEENTLRVQIRNLRRALSRYDADCYIVSRSGRGYAFVAPDVSGSNPANGMFAGQKPNSPNAGRLIGRDDIVKEVIASLSHHRLVTLTGTGGIGKTAVALEVGRRCGLAGTVFYADFSSLRDESLVPSMLVQALGLSISDRSPSESIARRLANERALLILDTCEHVVDGVAPLVETLLNDTSELQILVTSREVLRARGEWVTRLWPLSFPEDEGVDIGAPVSGAYAAIELFIERVAACGFHLVPDEDDMATIGRICARLDGLPLAIELAAARAEQFGIRGLLQRIDRHLNVLTDGFRTGLPRQRTMKSTLDWSYDLLAGKEQRLLNRLATFRSAFTAEMAIAIAADRELSEQGIFDGLNLLYRKSLLSLRQLDSQQSYRLLDTTRAYALDRLNASGEQADIHCRHAMYVRKQLQSGKIAHGFPSKQAADTVLQEVRAALDWAFSADGDIMIAFDLVLAAVPFWFQRSLIDECRRRIEEAIARLEGSEGSDQRAMEFHAALGGAYMNIEGAGSHTRSAFLSVLSLSGRLRNIDYRLRALWGLWVDTRNRGRYGDAVILSRRFERLAVKSGDAHVRMNANRMQGISHFFTGNFTASRRYVERVLANEPDSRDITTFQFDQRVTSRCFLAQILWLQGFPEQALAVASRNVEDAIAINHPGTISYSLTEGACPVAWNTGDLAALERFSSQVLERTPTKGMEVWRVIGECFDGILKLDRGDDAGLTILKDTLSVMRTECLAPVFSRALARYALALLQRDRRSEAVAAVDEAVQRARESSEYWCLPELLRIKGVVYGTIDTDVAQGFFEEALAIAQAQGALGWQLRVAISLAEFFDECGEPARAYDLLHDTYCRFEEGFGTADLRYAACLIERLAPSPQPPVTTGKKRNAPVHRAAELHKTSLFFR